MRWKGRKTTKIKMCVIPLCLSEIRFTWDCDKALWIGDWCVNRNYRWKSYIRKDIFFWLMSGIRVLHGTLALATRFLSLFPQRTVWVLSLCVWVCIQLCVVLSFLILLLLLVIFIFLIFLYIISSRFRVWFTFFLFSNTVCDSAFPILLNYFDYSRLETNHIHRRNTRNRKITELFIFFFQTRKCFTCTRAKANKRSKERRRKRHTDKTNRSNENSKQL